MDIYQAIDERQTIRDFSSRQIPDETIKKILRSAFKAPSNNHLRNWHFLLLNDRERRLEIINKLLKPISRKGAIGIVNRWQLIDDKQRDMYIDAIPKQISMLRDCQCLILPCFRQEADLLKPNNLSDLNGFASIWLAIENLLLAAAAEGIFGVTRIPFEEERAKIKNACQIPAGYEIPCWIALGYPAEGARRASQLEIDLVERIHNDTW
ncbi:MAG: nitroreductase family protein [Leptolinea sp.]|nr:nitroreductase family protein [Leptolinea sp.]